MITSCKKNYRNVQQATGFDLTLYYCLASQVKTGLLMRKVTSNRIYLYRCNGAKAYSQSHQNDRKVFC